MTDPIALNRIRQIAIVVKDLDRAMAFYRDTLGMTLLFQAPPALAFFDCSGVRLMLSVPGPDEIQTGTSILYYAVADIDAAHAALTAKGVDFPELPHRIAEMPDHDLWMGALRDSEGNLLCLMEERKDRGKLSAVSNPPLDPVRFTGERDPAVSHKQKAKRQLAPGN